MRPVLPFLLAGLLSAGLLLGSFSPRPAAAASGGYAALGASETYGVGATPRSQSYAFLVARGLHASRFVDTGVPGAALNQVYDTEVARALAIHPQLCTAFFGFNDLRQGVPRASFLSDLHDLSVTLRRGGCHVLIIGLPDLSVVPAVKRAHLTGVKQIVESWNRGMKQVARKTHAHYLDLSKFSAELVHHPEYISADGLHPSNRGYARIAQVVLNTIHRKHLWP